MTTGINKYGIKLEDYNDYAAYRKAYKNAANRATYKKHGKAYHFAYYHKPEGKSSKLKSCAKYYKTPNGVARSVINRSIKNNRLPKWADLEAIRQFYYNCPKGYEVDHIVPFNGKNVSGLHVLNNLQYLTKIDNLKKGNTWICSS